MKKLHLIRHAKSSWDENFKADVDRPLSQRGQNACRIMANPIIEAGCSFENTYCSIASRTQMTIEGLSAALPGKDIEWHLDKNLYTFSSRELLDWVHQLGEELSEVVMIGHNPGMTDFCNAMGDRYIANMPTCAYAQLLFPQDSWSDLSPKSGKLATFLTPKTVQ